MKEIFIDKVESFSNNARIVFMAAEIQRKMNAGASLEQILAENIVGMKPDEIKEEAAQIIAGINSVSESMKQKTDSAWVQEKINGAIINLDNAQRVNYLKNVIVAMTSANAGIKLEETDKAEMDRICDLESPANEDVETLISIVVKFTDDLSILFQRATMSGVMSHAHSLDSNQAEEYIHANAFTATSYAAANYIQLKCGKNSNYDIDTPAFMVANSSATTVENSKLIALYASGKITFDDLVDKTKNLFKVFLTGSLEKILQVASFGLFALFQYMISDYLQKILIHFGLTVYLPGSWIWIICLGTGGLIQSKIADVDDIEEILRSIANGITQIGEEAIKAWNSACKYLTKLLHRETEETETAESEMNAVKVMEKEKSKVDNSISEETSEKSVDVAPWMVNA